MRKLIQVHISLCLSILFIGCDDSATEQFDKANEDVAEKLVESISIKSLQDQQISDRIEISYNEDGSLNTATDGTGMVSLVYENEKLSGIIGGSSLFNIEELYGSPHDAFETGDVLLYDEKGNPEIIEFIEEEFDPDYNGYVMRIMTLELTYDNTPNPYFYTLKSGGIIEVLDNVQLNFSPNPQAPEIIQARLLLPFNNPSKLIYKNEEDEIVTTVDIAYIYDGEDYPSAAYITVKYVDIDLEFEYEVEWEYVE